MSADLLARATHAFFGITVAVALVMFVSLSVQADFDGSGCICYYDGLCQYDEQGNSWRYYQCTGACYAYSEWHLADEYTCERLRQRYG